MAAQSNAHPLISKLESITDLTPEETQALADLPMHVESLRPDQAIVREGDRPSRCCALIEGFACRSKMTSDGKRQIFAFHVPGDIPDLQSVHLRVMDHTLCTVTLCKVGFIHHEDMHRLFAEHSRLVGVFWRDTLIDAAIFRHWMLGIGRKSAYGRIAHLFCELFIKLQAVSLTQDHTFPLPITQAELGDALGLSTIHVNRTLMDLRRDGLIVTKGASLTIKDWEALTKAGDFDPTYRISRHARVSVRLHRAVRPGAVRRGALRPQWTHEVFMFSPASVRQPGHDQQHLNFCRYGIASSASL